MSFEKFIQTGWQRHANHTDEVAASLKSTRPETAQQVGPYAQLVLHVYGEHLGRFGEGNDLLGGLVALCAGNEEAMQGLARAIATFEVCAGKPAGNFPASDAARIHAMAASALCGAGFTEKAKSCLDKALGLAEKLSGKDPAFRALAVTGNNMAAGLEEKKDRKPVETELMLSAAGVGRRFWEKAGTWLETERAEYRWAKSCLAAGDSKGALDHSLACLAICEANNAEAMELFCAHEVLFLAEKAAGKKPNAAKAREYFAKLGDDDQKWFEPYLKALQ